MGDHGVMIQCCWVDADDTQCTSAAVAFFQAKTGKPHIIQYIALCNQHLDHKKWAWGPFYWMIPKDLYIVIEVMKS